jgi:conjugal transfer/entry exclusion protein
LSNLSENIKRINGKLQQLLKQHQLLQKENGQLANELKELKNQPGK